MDVQWKSGDVVFDTSTTTATNAVFIPVGTAVTGELPSELHRPVSVRLSVRLSCWCIISRMLKISSNSFFSPVAPSFYFLSPSAGTQSQLGNPFSVGAKYTGWENFAIFTEIAVYLGNGTIGHWLLIVNRKSWAADRSVSRFRWPWVTSDPDFKVTTCRISEKRCYKALNHKQ